MMDGHPDYIQIKKLEEIIPIYETTYPLTSGLSHKKIKAAASFRSCWYKLTPTSFI